MSTNPVLGGRHSDRRYRSMEKPSFAAGTGGSKHRRLLELPAKLANEKTAVSPQEVNAVITMRPKNSLSDALQTKAQAV